MPDDDMAQSMCHSTFIVGYLRYYLPTVSDLTDETATSFDECVVKGYAGQLSAVITE